MIGVLGRIQGRKLIAHRQFVAVCGDELDDVVATLHGYREPRERPGDRDARREPVGVTGHRARLFPSGHHVDAMVRFAHHRAAGLQGFQVRIRVGDDATIHEEVHVIHISHEANASRSYG